MSDLDLQKKLETYKELKNFIEEYNREQLQKGLELTREEYEKKIEEASYLVGDL